MSDGSLILHRGAREVTLDELGDVPAPPATRTWFPISHARVLSTVVDTLDAGGFGIAKQSLALSADNARFFGVLRLCATVAEGVGLSVGIRNSIDRSLPLGFCAGQTVFCCDNLAFRSELLVTRKHTAFGGQRFAEAIAKAVGTLVAFQTAEGTRIAAMRSAEINETSAESLILRAYDQGIVSHLALPKVISEWRQPSHEEFQPRTTWSLLNAFTSALQERSRSNPQAYALQSMRLYALLSPERVIDGTATSAIAV